MLTVSKSPSLFASYFWWRGYYKEEFCDHKIVCHKKSYQEVFLFFYFKSSFIKYYHSRLIVICVLLFMKHNICLEFIRTSKTGGQVTKYANNFQKMKLKKQMKVCGNGNIHDSWFLTSFYGPPRPKMTKTGLICREAMFTKIKSVIFDGSSNMQILVVN